MYHSITFGDKNTWDDWHLISSTRPVFNPPRPKMQYWEIPGMNGKVDGTENLVGYTLYENRTGSFEFIVENGHWDWQTAYSTIMNYLHGKRMRAVMEDAPGFFYEGRFSVNSWKSDKNWSTIVIDYDVGPYRQNVVSSMDPWIWDTFNFESDVIQDGNAIRINGETMVYIIGSQMRICPKFTASSDMTIRFEGETYAIPANVTTQIFEIELVEGQNDLVITGQGTIDIEYRAGEL